MEQKGNADGYFVSRLYGDGKPINRCVLSLYVLIFFTGLFQLSFGDDPVVEPENLSGIQYSTSGLRDFSGSCPDWFTALDRNSTDSYTEERLIVELDGCKVFEYEVFTMEQGSQTGVLADLEPDDIFIVWDEDAGHGSNQDFTFSGSYVQEEPDYVHVYSTNNQIINWKVYRVTASGTLTVNDTGLNEHDAIHLKRNYMWFEKDDDLNDANDLDCRSPGDDITYTIC